MSIVTNIGNFPNTISGLTNPPNTDAPTMQGLLEQDCKALWEAVQDMVDELNDKITTTLNYQSTDDQLVTAKAVFDLVTAAISGDTPITPEAIGAASLDTYGKVKPEQLSARVVSVTISSGTPLDLSHAGAFLSCNCQLQSGGTIIVPADTSVNFPVGTEIFIFQYNSIPVTVSGASGVTVSGVDGKVKTGGQNDVIGLKKIAANSWIVIGGSE